MGALEAVSIADGAEAKLVAPEALGADVWRAERTAASPGSGSFMRMSVKSPTTSHPLQGDGDVPASSLPLGRAASPHSVGRAASPLSVGRAASPLSVGRAASPLSVGSSRRILAEIADPVDEHEERQRQLFRAAEQRRLHREDIARSSLSSEDIAVLRSGLSNAHECAAPSELPVLNGAFPEGLRGDLYLLGPGRFDVRYNVQRELEQATRVFTYGHILDVPPLLTKISFDPQRRAIVHRARLIARQAAGRVQTEHGITTKVPGALYMSDTNQTVLGRILPRGTHHPSAEGECCGQAVHLGVPVQGSTETVVCTNHVCALQRIDPGDLHPRATVELRDISRAFKGALSCPHMQHDPGTGEHFAVLQDVGFRSTTYTVVSLSAAQPDGHVVARFTEQAAVLHSFAITRDYVIVPVYPYSAPIGGMAYRWGDSLLEALSFDRSRPALFYVISREYRRVQCVYKCPAFFALHQVGAAQDPAADAVSLDMVAYSDDAVLRRLQVDALRRPGAPRIPAGELRRFQLAGITAESARYAGPGAGVARLPLARSLALRIEPVELVQISPAAAMRPYAFAYGLAHIEALQAQSPGQPAGGAMYNCIVKLDVGDPAAPPLTWSRTHCYPSEPVFVPRPDDGHGSRREDDGFVLSVFFDSMRITSCLLVLDARTFKEVMIAQLPAAVPISFGHSKFWP
ncbi:hypothetical protein H4R18_002576 [Coemansia javaensis]|uniref:Uncharacterized protein n=1 Tax=Coemansia javaensis TaxID=2761396 RepID=A0A9W8LJU6_9FUNG|nr:hypothetical protein H4R18_002576 [Coemansia javaensis]